MQKSSLINYIIERLEAINDIDNEEEKIIEINDLIEELCNVN